MSPYCCHLAYAATGCTWRRVALKSWWKWSVLGESAILTCLGPYRQSRVEDSFSCFYETFATLGRLPHGRVPWRSTTNTIQLKGTTTTSTFAFFCELYLRRNGRRHTPYLLKLLGKFREIYGASPSNTGSPFPAKLHVVGILALALIRSIAF